jgi:hypothetical protein
MPTIHRAVQHSGNRSRGLLISIRPRRHALSTFAKVAAGSPVSSAAIGDATTLAVNHRGIWRIPQHQPFAQIGLRPICSRAWHYSSEKNLSLPPDPFRHQDSAIVPARAAQQMILLTAPNWMTKRLRERGPAIGDGPSPSWQRGARTRRYCVRMVPAAVKLFFGLYPES